MSLICLARETSILFDIYHWQVVFLSLDSKGFRIAIPAILIWPSLPLDFEPREGFVHHPVQAGQGSPLQFQYSELGEW
jgi:hypothetical protein